MKKLNVSISVVGIMLSVSIGSQAAEPGKVEMPNLNSGSSSSKSKDAYFVRVDRETTTEANKQDDPDKKIAPDNKNTAGLPAGKRQHKPFVITKELDKASEENANANPNLKKSGDVTMKRGL